jgi:hypothetical protein
MVALRPIHFGFEKSSFSEKNCNTRVFTRTDYAAQRSPIKTLVVRSGEAVTKEKSC